jgi:site-specific DNA recombinase
MRAVTYARVSGDDSRKEDRNLRSQQTMYQEYCQDRGYSIVAELAEDDRGASGASWDLPELNEALDMARAGKFDVLVTRELDRFARGLAKQLVVEDQFRRYGVEVEYVLEQYDDTPEGRLSKNVRAIIAEYEREKTRQRMIRGRRDKVRDGHVMVHGQPPFGYERETVNGKVSLVIADKEAEVVRLIFSLYVNEDLTLSGVTNYLDAHTIPSCTDLRGHTQSRKTRGYGEWSIATVSKIVSNETYTGIWTYANNPDLAVEVPALIDPMLWERAQRKKAQNWDENKRRLKYQYLMRRRLWCGDCNSKMVGRSKKSGGKLYKYYICQAKSRFARECSMSIHFRVDQVDGVIWGWTRDLWADPEHLKERVKEQKQKWARKIKPMFERAKIVEELRLDHERQLDRLLDLYLSGDFDKEMLLDRKVRLEQAIRALEIEQCALTLEGSLQAREAKLETVEKVAQSVHGQIKQAEGDFDTRRKLIETLGVEATLLVDENGQKWVNIRSVVGEEATLSIDAMNFCSR